MRADQPAQHDHCQEIAGRGIGKEPKKTTQWSKEDVSDEGRRRYCKGSLDDLVEQLLFLGDRGSPFCEGGLPAVEGLSASQMLLGNEVAGPDGCHLSRQRLQADLVGRPVDLLQVIEDLVVPGHYALRVW